MDHVQWISLWLLPITWYKHANESEEVGVVNFNHCHTLSIVSPNLTQPNAVAYLLRDNPLLRSFLLDSNLLELGFNCIFLHAAIFESLIDLVDEHGAVTRGAMHHGDEFGKQRIWDGCLWYWLGGSTRSTLLGRCAAICRGGRITQFDVVRESGDDEAICSLGFPRSGSRLVALPRIRDKSEGVDRVRGI